MSTRPVKKELLEELDRLGIEDQHRVLEFVRTIRAARPRGTPGSDLIRFAGVLSTEEADRMMAVIEDGCERVDADGW
ncbi:MAG: hypothetical protein WD942_05785 [Dehalococcoidia bacterium]